MLARRFTIVCLLLTLFGMGFAILVAKASRPARSWEIGMVVACDFENGLRCAPRRRGDLSETDTQEMIKS
ncbi:MAG: hypothetical protein H0T56_06595 [Pseudaminobacter sp.]|nr:hypothetical protein [Pseudaminobacter sp.]